jgi:predicted kinase
MMSLIRVITKFLIRDEQRFQFIRQGDAFSPKRKKLAMNKGNPRVILIVGPAGSGKTSLAERIARNEDWALVSEDVYWGEIKKDQLPHGGRTAAEQEIVWPAVLGDVEKLLAVGKNVVLEFLNYETPPRPLMYYLDHLQRPNIEIKVGVLHPTDAAIMERKKTRGRKDDQDYLKEIRNTRHQLTCLESGYICADWLIDNSHLSVDETYNKYFIDFCENETGIK